MIDDFIAAIRTGYRAFKKDWRTRRTKRRTRAELLRERDPFTKETT